MRIVRELRATFFGPGRLVRDRNRCNGKRLDLGIAAHFQGDGLAFASGHDVQ